MKKRSEQSQEPSRASHINTRLGDILGNYSAGADYNVVANRDGKNRRIRSDADIVAKLGRTPEIAVSRRAPLNKEIVNEHRSVRDEAVVPDRDELTNKCM